jgi:hypothetical protein
VIVRLIAADKMPRNFYENRNRKLVLCSRNATKSSAEAVSRQHTLHFVQHEFAGNTSGSPAKWPCARVDWDDRSGFRLSYGE